jgi:hypothetical protein
MVSPHRVPRAPPFHAEAGNPQKADDFRRQLADLWRNEDPQLRNIIRDGR